MMAHEYPYSIYRSTRLPASRLETRLSSIHSFTDLILRLLHGMQLQHIVTWWPAGLAAASPGIGVRLPVPAWIAPASWSAAISALAPLGSR